VRYPRNTNVAYFGYINANAFGLPVPIGTSNQMSPAPADRGQSASFLPGAQVRRVPGSLPAGGSITWHLNGRSLTATTATPPCT
jgi:hypothetical protein